MHPHGGKLLEGERAEASSQSELGRLESTWEPGNEEETHSTVKRLNLVCLKYR